MNRSMPVKDNINRFQVAPADLRNAKELAQQQPAKAWVGLNDLFRNSRAPEPFLNGRYAGELIAIDIVPGLTQFFRWLLRMWMPWLGKTFDASASSGNNIFTKDSYPLARFFNPLYRGFQADKRGSYRAFTFRTSTAPGLADPDRMVLKIDYDLKENPSLTIRRVLDELVQVDENLYLGKAHVHWWWGGWQTVAYFTLSQENYENII